MTGWRRVLPSPDDLTRGWFFLRRAVAKARRDDLHTLSTALAFITIVSLVPLLAAGSSLGALAFVDRQGRLVEILGAVLPYSEEAIMVKLREFLEQASAIRGVGVLGLLATGLVSFVTIEQALNRVWSVSGRRPFMERLRAFTVVVFWGPLVIGATYASLLLLSRRVASSPLGSTAAHLVPFVVTFLGLSALYWLVPYTRVAGRSAMAGALTAAVLLEVLRRGIGLYLVIYQRVSVIYGGLGLALLFMISIQIAWWLVLLGSEVAWSVQHRDRLLRPRRAAAGLSTPWLGLVALVTVVDRFRAGTPIVQRTEVASWLGIEDDDLPPVLAPLLAGGWLVPSSDARGVILSCDPYQLEAETVLSRYDEADRSILASVPPDLAERLDPLRRRVESARAGALDGVTVAALVAGGVEAESP